jgi:hypothetical protein
MNSVSLISLKKNSVSLIYEENKENEEEKR